MLWYWDATYIFVIIGAVITAIASHNIHSTYKRFSQLANRRGLTAQEVADRILHSAGIYDVGVEQISGSLTDHYSPRDKRLRLSDTVYGQTSVAALGVAAHECGHAIQHQQGYLPLKLRSASVPLANIGSTLAWPVIFIGLAMGYTGLARVGVLFFALVILFQLITLPVEFDASHRALAILEGDSILEGEELSGARKVLTAAALTYVAAVFSSILQLLRLLILTRRRDD